ncbi:MAG: FIST C-terminal domain-containing protein [Kiritimatiellae bacterium]|nr:FIST C-terminal domain-containing protein [Kiritimatiellia bacterium]
MKAGVGCSTLDDSAAAARQAAEQAVRSAGQPALTILFTTDPYDQKAVHAACREVVGPSRLVGFCCGGIISRGGVLTRGVGVCALSGPEIRAATTLRTGLSRDSREAGRRAAADLLAGGIDRGIVLVFPDGFGANVADTVRGLYERLGPDFQYAGGGAGDNLRFFRTYQFTEAGIESDALAAGLLGGITVATAIGHGWSPRGEPLVIGETQGKNVLALDGKKAFDAWCERLGQIKPEDFPAQGMRHPLGFPDISGHYLIRDALAVAGDGSIRFVTELPQNSVGYIMDGQMPDLIRMAGTVVRSAVSRVPVPRFALCFDCISRYLLMGDEFTRELAAIDAALGKDLPLLGALTFGEIGSYADVPLFHNKTLAVVVGGDGV